MSELRDAIARMVDVNDSDGDLYDIETADAVLAMPELAAIRSALYRMAVDVDDSLRPNPAEWLAIYDLPASVVAWVLEGE